jgi:hypothetical protein
MELFAEAGAIVAERAMAAGAGHEVVAGILRRAAEQAGMLVSKGTTAVNANQREPGWR